MTLIFVTGGARSGKSSFAEKIAQERAESSVTYLATAQAFDTEMEDRIARHRTDRPAEWHTVEEPLDVLVALQAAPTPTVLLDCLSLWVSNLLLSGLDEEVILARTDAVLHAQTVRGGLLIAVTNEVGSGIVPDNALARSYRDILGRVNQRFAAASAEAYLLASGLPLQLK
ncbi:bifunctional adenosylcobinamide kinase/adenosylcobinamide-phosphate guanylyltransferase [Deinococcus sp. QL22]|uniref:bifunctional adenosylcobinamide kinase/adenosylcobinamide-phosphate guanylyltransferase n=1 Tax=Deinococcus sp. QL22 TaxID=2939437 RepID=UPI002017459F|nr:bifunctional adenosylcobinamide kinase/adenosylcobinamide-phosphate guanylyltransferase [Deinococcus sp. QL22]UQN07450.1 bifunctional adenosylcobinamide kinase/adenosylcobinamide-phosphate guanylyltransferase [Deinococcus sp. QL22]